MRPLQTAVFALVPLLLAPVGASLVAPLDSDGDGFADAVERVLGASPYDAGDDPSGVGVNALVNPGFELQAQPVAGAVTCPAFGDTAVNVAGLVIVSPCYTSVLNSLGWNTGQTQASQAMSKVRDADGDGDLEMDIPAVHANGHSFWHPYANAQQAFSANFAALTFDIEVDGASAATIPNNALIQLSLSLTPWNDVNTFVPAYIECGLNFRGSLLKSAGTLTPIPGPDGATYLRVGIEPQQGQFFSRWEGCDDEAAAWAGMSGAERRALLGTMRLVQTSFWQFNGLVLDNVDMRGSTLALPAP